MKATDRVVMTRTGRGALLFATYLMSTLIVTACAGASDRPNIILCMADDQGWGDVGYYGKSIAKTPVLDEMAATGLRFDRFYSASCVCSPTRGSVMTGRHPNRYACFSWGHSLRPEEVTVAEALARAGYTTGHFGKWHLGSVDPRSDVSPGASGFDRWFSSPNFYENDPLMCDNGRVVRTQGESSMVTMESAIQFIRDATRKKSPFLAVVWFGSPHSPHVAIAEDRGLYADQPENLQHYYGEITGIDRSMGMLREELRDLQIAENTLLWYTSDNGPQGPKDRGRPGSSGGLRDRKGTLWEGGVRVPTLIEWPARAAKHRVISTPCNTVDIYPTLVDIAGAAEPNQPVLDGISILPVIDNKMDQRPKPMGFWTYSGRGIGVRSSDVLEMLEQSLAAGTAPDSEPNDEAARDARAAAATRVLHQQGFIGHAALIDNRFKLHRLPKGDDSGVTYELYNLDKDPAETRDLAGEMPERVAVMRRQLAAWQASVAGSLAGEDYARGEPSTTERASANIGAIRPLVRVADLSIGETAVIELADGQRSSVKLLDLTEHRDALSNAVRRAEVTVEVDGKQATLVSATYNLPQLVGKVQIDCSVTRGYGGNSTKTSWGLKKDARLRVWPADSPWIRPETFIYPAKQRWFATHTQMANVPTYVDGGDQPTRKNIYYHSGLDIGGTEGCVEVVAATDGLVLSAGMNVLDETSEETPVRPRYDVVYLRDARGWYYRYSHLKEIDERIKPGRVISMGDRIGLLGKEGASGGWTHLHFEIKTRQPSGEWGTQAGYAFLWQAYLQQYDPAVIAVARPHHFIWTGEETTLDASKSWGKLGGSLEYQWTLHDGSKANSATLKRRYDEAGSFSEIVRVSDAAGNFAYDFADVQVINRAAPDRLPPTVHPTYYPTFGINPGDPVRFTVRSFRTTAGKETWDFGDGSPPVEVQSDGNAEKLNPEGYAVTTHRYENPGDYLVTVERTNEFGYKATGHLHVQVEPQKPMVRVLKEVPYLGSDRKETLDLYLPEDDGGSLRPAIVIIHGGGWWKGDKGSPREQNIGNTLAQAGYVCASINYLLAKQGEQSLERLRDSWPQNIHDCKTAVRFLRKHADRYNIDANHIGAIGGSAGGHLAAMLAVTDPEDGLDPEGLYAGLSCRIQAVVPMYGVHDLLERATFRGAGEMSAEQIRWARSVSPASYVSSDDPPALILHGTKDALVPISQSRILFGRLRDAQVDAEIHVIEGAPHSFHLQPKQRDLRSLVVGFFDRCLKQP